MSHPPRKKRLSARLAGSTFFTVGAVGVIVLVGGMAVTGLIAWLHEDASRPRGSEGPTDAPAPRSPQAAVRVARTYWELMLARKYEEAALYVAGPAAEAVRSRIAARHSDLARKDPELARLIEEGLVGSVERFEADEAKVADRGDTVTFVARLRVRLAGEEQSFKTLMKVVWVQDRWAVMESLPVPETHDAAPEGRWRF